MAQEIKLKKALTPMQVCALALGSIIGWGCFVLPSDTFLPSAGPMGTLIGLLVGASLISFIAVCLYYMMKYAPVAGGAFVYAYLSYGAKAAYVCGWALVIGYIAVVGIDIAALAVIGRFLFPGIFEFGELYTIAGWKVYTGEAVLMIAGNIIFAWINYKGISIAGKLQLFMTFLLVAGILLLFGGVSSLDTASISNLSPLFVSDKSIISSVLLILAISPFLFAGFDTIPQTVEEFAFDADRARNLMIIAIFAGCALYALVMISVGIAVPYTDLLKALNAERLADGAAWGTGTVAVMAFGKMGGFLLAIATFGAACTGINGFYIAGSRLLLSMSRSKILPAWFGAIHPKYNTPYKAVLFIMLIAMLTPFAGRAVVLWTVDMTSVGTGIGYLFTCLAARKVILRDSGQNGRSLKLFYCMIGIFTSLLCIVLLLAPGSPAQIGTPPMICLAIWIILGIMFYLHNREHWMNLSEREMSESILGSDKIKVFFEK